MSYEEYAKTEGQNWSTLKEMKRSPKHYRHHMDAPLAATPAMLLGSAVHMAILEPEKFDEGFVVWDGGRRAGKAWQDFKGDNDFREILTVKEMATVAAMARAAQEDEAASYYLKAEGECEVPLQWREQTTMQLCKGRMDKVLTGQDARLLELKTARAVEPWKFASAAISMGYHGQLAYYHDGLKVARPELQLCAPVIIAVENVPPHDVVVYHCDDVMEAGRALYLDLLNKLADCRLAGTWPGISPCAVPLELPAWAEPEDDDLDWKGNA